jgi:hypothetical protein
MSSASRVVPKPRHPGWKAESDLLGHLETATRTARLEKWKTT